MEQRPWWYWVASIAAAAATIAILLAVTKPAHAHHDPNPPYVRSSQPGGLELYGFHHKQVSATTHAWIGLQRGPDGRYRWWGKAKGNGQKIVASFRAMHFSEGATTYGPSSCTTPAAAVVYCVGAWHTVQDLAVAMASVQISYATGKASGRTRLESYTIRRGQRAAWSAPPTRLLDRQRRRPDGPR